MAEGRSELLLGRGPRRRCLRVCSSCLPQGVPGSGFFPFADPRCEVGLEPGGREDVGQRFDPVTELAQQLAGCDRCHEVRRREILVEGVEEVLAVVVVMLPGVLSVDHDGDHHWALDTEFIESILHVLEAVHEVVGCGAAGRTRVLEADEVRELNVPEEDRELRVPGVLRRVHAVEDIGVDHRPTRVSFERSVIERLAEHVLARRGPLDAFTRHDRRHFLSHRSLSRQHAGWAPPEESLGNVESSCHLLPGVTGFSEPLIRHDRCGISDESEIRVGDEREDRMSER